MLLKCFVHLVHHPVKKTVPQDFPHLLGHEVFIICWFKCNYQYVQCLSITENDTTTLLFLGENNP